MVAAVSSLGLVLRWYCSPPLTRMTPDLCPKQQGTLPAGNVIQALAEFISHVFPNLQLCINGGPREALAALVFVSLGGVWMLLPTNLVSCHVMAYSHCWLPDVVALTAREDSCPAVLSQEGSTVAATLLSVLPFTKL